MTRGDQTTREKAVLMLISILISIALYVWLVGPQK